MKTPLSFIEYINEAWNFASTKAQERFWENMNNETMHGKVLMYNEYLWFFEDDGLVADRKAEGYNEMMIKAYKSISNKYHHD